jgi:hypothetical protein
MGNGRFRKLAVTVSYKPKGCRRIRRTVHKMAVKLEQASTRLTQGRRRRFILFIFSLFYDTFSVTKDYIASNDSLISECWIGKNLEGSGRGLIFRCCPDLHLEGLKENTKNLSQGGRSLGQDLNPWPPEYGVLTTHPQRQSEGEKKYVTEWLAANLNCIVMTLLDQLNLLRNHILKQLIFTLYRHVKQLGWLQIIRMGLWITLENKKCVPFYTTQSQNVKMTTQF